MFPIKIITVFVIILQVFAIGANVFATESPDFTVCANPSGEVISKYDSGTFGIAGKNGSFAGSDVVYRASENGITQCFCDSGGNGTQTNWQNASQMEAKEINEMIATGWILIPDGTSWGLSSDPYLAQNSNYSCGANSNVGVLAASSGVLGLATTGNAQTAAILSALGLFFLILGIRSFRK